MPHPAHPEPPGVPAELPRPGPSSPVATWLADRFDHPSITPARLLGGLAALVLAAAVAWWLLRPPPPPREAQLPRLAVAGASGPATPRPRPPAAPVPPVGPAPAAPVVAAAAGAVNRPGVYRLAPGARVDDLVRAAGGLAAAADIDRLNLAAPLADGERLYAPKVGEVPPTAVALDGGAVPGAMAGPAGAPRSGRKAPPTAPIDLNLATADQLGALPGVGPATVQAILTYRQAHGRFRSVDDLRQVHGIGPAKLARLRSLVRVDG